jgi:hypothetical protein
MAPAVNLNGTLTYVLTQTDIQHKALVMAGAMAAATQLMAQAARGLAMAVQGGSDEDDAASKMAERESREVDAPQGKPDYTAIPDPEDLATNTRPTPRQVKEMKRLNREHNGGVLRDDVTGELMQDSSKSTRGVTPPTNEAQVDHIIPQSRGGTRSSSNLELRTRKNNRDKSNKLPGEE